MLIFPCGDMLHYLLNGNSPITHLMAVELIEVVIGAVWDSVKSNNLNYIHQTEYTYINVYPEELISERAIDLSDLEESSVNCGGNVHFFINAMFDIYESLPDLELKFGNIMPQYPNRILILWRDRDVFIQCS